MRVAVFVLVVVAIAAAEATDESLVQLEERQELKKEWKAMEDDSILDWGPEGRILDIPPGPNPVAEDMPANRWWGNLIQEFKKRL